MIVAVVAGARPNVVKVAPILRELRRKLVPYIFIWSGQHKGALDLRGELDCPEPDVDLPRDESTAHALLDVISMQLVQKIAKWERKPDVMVVVGDVTSTLAAAMAAACHRIPVVHVEAGLRSGDWAMPEERNRILVDRLSDLRLTTERSAWENLVNEGMLVAPSAKCDGQDRRWQGNVMIDSLHWAREQPTNIREALRIEGKYAVVTLHRPQNVDTDAALEKAVRAVSTIAEKIPVYWPVHPRLGMERAAKAEVWWSSFPLHLTHPLTYRDTVTLLAGATLVATDSGGVQEETTALGVPCLTLRENTERPITVEQGTNEVVGLDPERVSDAVRRVLDGSWKKGTIPEGWDGKAAERIVEAIVKRYSDARV
jgi:UDP-N-acetylglucosamine 2-epimerase (non-hydrolysing)